MNGGLAYAEFCRLSPDTIRTLEARLGDALGAVHLARCKTKTMRYLNDPDNLLDQDPGWTLDDTLQAEFYAIEETLRSILRLPKRPVSVEEVC